MENTSLTRLRQFLLSPSLESIPCEIDFQAAEQLLGCDRGCLIHDRVDLWMQSQDQLSPLYGWARTEHLDSNRISAWTRNYNR
jgi:hypothetical protein